MIEITLTDAIAIAAAAGAAMFWIALVCQREWDKDHEDAGDD